MKTSIFVTVIMLSACMWTRGEEEDETVAHLTLSSPSFQNGQPIPAKYSCKGENASPALNWEGVPAGTKSFALICDDPDAPGGSWVHWVIYGIPANTVSLPENIQKRDAVEAPGSMSGRGDANGPGAKQGVNDFGKVGYGGPCPPRGRGAHHYDFQLYALDAELKLAPRATRKQLKAAMKGHIIGEAELSGSYQRD